MHTHTHASGCIEDVVTCTHRFCVVVVNHEVAVFQPLAQHLGPLVLGPLRVALKAGNMTRLQPVSVLIICTAKGFEADVITNTYVYVEEIHPI
eukprot:9178786-Heterocapsa_arctica.AAC.1